MGSARSARIVPTPSTSSLRGDSVEPGQALRFFATRQNNRLAPINAVILEESCLPLAPQDSEESGGDGLKNSSWMI